MASDSEEAGIDLFDEPSDFYQPEKEATFASHRLLSGKDLVIRLVGHNPLWVCKLALHLAFVETLLHKARTSGIQISVSATVRFWR